MEFQTVPGRLEAGAIEAFYSRHQRQTRARDGDVFFLAKDEGRIVASVRYCVENSTSLLRGMLVDESMRGKGIGEKLLERFVQYLDSEGIHDVFCLPYPHLEKFYEAAGFKKVLPHEAPHFLVERMQLYRETQNALTVIMRRS